ncbi:MAG TPA: membrane dipeptidase [bacterium]|nr:membrane dipeptidase [bacterium]
MGELTSTLHTDMYRPKPEGEGKDYEIGDNGERIYRANITDRIEQFGITKSQVEEKFRKKAEELSWEEYNELMAELINRYYDVIVSSVFDKYLYQNEVNPEHDQRFKDLIGMTEKYHQLGAMPGMQLIRSSADFQNQNNLVLTLEGGTHLIKSNEDVKKMVDAGIKIFGLQYGGDESLNMIASKDGLTPFGKQVIKYLFEHNLVVDLAHSGYKTRQEVMGIAEESDAGRLLSYTHGSTEEDISPDWINKIGERALKKEEAERIITMGGIIGLCVSQPFFSGADHIAKRINQIAQRTGRIDRLAIGSDFGGLPPGLVTDIKGPEDLVKIADVLSGQFGFKDAEIEQVMRRSAKEWLETAIV